MGGGIGLVKTQEFGSSISDGVSVDTLQTS